MNGDKSTKGFSPLDLILTLICFLALSHIFIGHVPSVPFRWVIPYGSLPVLGAVLLITYWSEGARLQLEERNGGIWQALGINLTCTLLPFLFAAILHELSKWSLGVARTFELTQEVTVLQIVVILLGPLGLRFVWEKFRQRKVRLPLKTRMWVLPQLVPLLIILTPVAFMGYGSLLFQTSFHSNIAFAENRDITFYYADPKGKVIRSSLNSPQSPVSIPETLEPREILMFGEPPDYPLVAYDIRQRVRRPLNCSDCRFTSETVEAYRFRGRSEDWRNVYRGWGLHGEWWRPVDLDTETKYWVHVQIRYLSGNAEFLTADSPLGTPEDRIILRAQLPTMEWTWRYVYLLPGGEVLAQLGDNIVLLDLTTMRIGFVAEGSRPVISSY